ncbi:carboxypeptidase-like regulatory domain-containing protein [Patulibacter minatonensis]|uniref:carboxypeptidase-like regulatory domain-containing protein n=1 Tax=Patulibacter minatonensis TaxID=298163 RepID=UPI00047A94DE|nr:carboxypeptidase-like regulatory domain-containing protein [Patulibacter minatonensis]
MRAFPSPCPSLRRAALLPLVAGLLALGAAGPAGADGLGVPVSATIAGTVTAAQGGAPVPLALVEAVSGDTTVGSARADLAGHYAITGLPSRSDYTVRMSAPGYETTLGYLRGSDVFTPFTFDLRIGETYPFDFTLNRLDGHIRGRVVDLNGAPLAGVNVLQSLDHGSRGTGPAAIAEPTATTDANGRYDLPVYAGWWYLLAERPDLVRHWIGDRPSLNGAGAVEIAPGQTVDGVDFRLPPRPARSCWADGGYWIAGTADRPAPSFPPDAGDYCSGPLAPKAPLIVRDQGPFLVGGQHMDMIEQMEAVMMPATWSGRNPPTVRLVSDGYTGIAQGTPTPPPAVARPSGSAAPVAASLVGTRRVPVRRGRLVATTSCPAHATCRGALTVTVPRVSTRGRKAASLTIASTGTRTTRGTHRTTLRLTSTGTRMLRSAHGRLAATLRWAPAGSTKATVRSVRLESR